MKVVLLLAGVLGGLLLAVPARGLEVASGGATARATPTPSPLDGLSFLAPGATPSPTPTAEPAATPPPDELPARLALGQVRRAPRGFALELSARGGSLADVRVLLLRGARTLRSVAIAELTGTRRLTLKPRGGMTAGRYLIRVTLAGVVAATREVAVASRR